MPPKDLEAHLLAVLQVEDGVQLGGEGQEEKAGRDHDAAEGKMRGNGGDGGVGGGGEGDPWGFMGACEDGEGDRGGGPEMG